MPKSPLEDKKIVVPDEMENQEIHFRMEIIKENPDGSADFELNCNSYTTAKLVQLGVINLLKAHIEQEKQPKKAWWKIW